MFPVHEAPAIRPLYATRRPNASVLLHSGVIELTDERHGTEYVNARVSLDWVPSARIRIQADDVPLRFAFETFQARSLTARLPASPELHALSVSQAGTRGITARLSQPTQFGVLNGLASVVFHVPNFPRFHGLPIARGKRIWTGRLACAGEGWTVVVDETRRAGFLESRCKSVGGSGFTHVGRLDRVDGSAFSADEATDILDRVSYLLSFVRGAWSCCTLPVGFDDRGQARWAEWSSPNVSPAKPVLSWFSTFHPDAVRELFPGFLMRFGDKRWREPLRRALAWYFACNSAHGPLYTHLVVQQAALELLAWTLFVEVGGASANRFDKLPAAKRLRRLLSKAGIPVELPTQLHELAGAAQKYGWSDGPDAVVEMRNAVVHPSRKQPVPFKAVTDAWRLGVWYLEMVILWLCDFRGEYHSRLSEDRWHGHTERVPWARET